MADLDFSSLVDFFSGRKKQQPAPVAQPPSRWPLLDEIYGRAPEASAAPPPRQFNAPVQPNPADFEKVSNDVNEFFRKHFNLVPRNRLKEAGLE